MLKTRVRVTSCVLWLVFTVLGFYSPNPASAETYTATQETRDFYFATETAMTVTIRTYAQQYGIDSMLWVYDDENTLLTANDDWFGLDSFVSFETTAGVTYRLRAGVCCGDPERWYGTSYVIEPSMVPTNAPTTTQPELPTTTLEPTTTTEAPTTTTTSTTSSTTTTTTSTTVVVTTTTTEVVVPTSLPPSTSTSSSTTTTSAPTTTVASTTVPPVSSTAPSTTTVPPVTQTTTTSLVPETFPSTTTIAPSESIAQGLEPEEALAIVTSAAVLQELSSSEANKVFDAVEVSELTDEQATALVEAVQDAPEEVRAAFEDQINVFGGKFDKYVPLGSAINVGQRKVLIAATGVLFMAPTVSVSSSTSGSSSDSRRKK